MDVEARFKTLAKLVKAAIEREGLTETESRMKRGLKVAHAKREKLRACVLKVHDDFLGPLPEETR